VAEFAEERHFAGALAMLRDQGYSSIETYTPYPVERTHSALPMPPSVLPLMVFFGGLAGGATAYWVQWYTNVVSYPLDIGGRPAHAVPAFFIPTFEGTVLAAALTAFVLLLVVLRLPRPWHPVFEAEGIERAAIDHFFIAIDLSDPRADAVSTRRDLDRVGALRVTQVAES
jgi:hypothetical protein